MYYRKAVKVFNPLSPEGNGEGRYKTHFVKTSEIISFVFFLFAFFFGFLFSEFLLVTLLSHTAGDGNFVAFTLFWSLL